MYKVLFSKLVLFGLVGSECVAASPSVPMSVSGETPLVVAVDLDVGERSTVTLSDGSRVEAQVLALEEQRDSVCFAVREAKVTVQINGEEGTLISATYNLPRVIGGVQVDSPITKNYLQESRGDSWGLVKDVRLRFWPKGSPWIRPESFTYPARQRWFASDTQMANEPVFVDGGDIPGTRAIYYHSGLDIGGAEGMTEVIAATDATIVSVGDTVLSGYEESPVSPRYDVVYALDARGWYYRYSHLFSIEAMVKPGVKVRKGQKIGILGKEGGSGGWSHLHFEIKSRQPSGLWGTQEGYAFLWQAYEAKNQTGLIAVARPHQLAWAGEPVTLDASKSWSQIGRISEYDWTFTDGSSAKGATLRRIYDTPGYYSEMVRIRDEGGRTAYDFAKVQVFDRDHPDLMPATIHPAYSPSEKIRVADPITFLVRAFRTQPGEATWDFGDGTAPVKVSCDGNLEMHSKDGYTRTIHRFGRPGDFLVSVKYVDQYGYIATGRLVVSVAE